MRLTLATEGVRETMAAVRGLERDLQKETNAEIRVAARTAAEGLVAALRVSASASGVPVAPRVSSSAKVRSDRFPTVAIGGSSRVGRRGAPASKLVWGSEHGPAGDPNHFGVPANAGGYWIKPAVDRFASGPALPIFLAAVVTIIRKHRL